jgi:hypothetical protein
MIESFVDLTYRGLPLGRRIKLTQVRPTSGYLEMPAPMPVGTLLAIATDEGVVIDARVSEIKEQVAGAEVVPGMKITPELGAKNVSSWWHARVALPEVEVEPTINEKAPQPPAEPERPKQVTVRPRNETVQTDPPAGMTEMPHHEIAAALKTVVEAAAAPPPVDTKRTTIMPAIDQELLAQLTKDTNIELFSGSQHPIVDDGNKTTVMTAIDTTALGLDDSGPTQTPDGDSPKSPRKRRTKKKP